MLKSLIGYQSFKIITDRPSRVQIICPGGMVTGGTESLHFLASEMRHLGVEAYLCYYPFKKSFNVPIEYADYNVVVSDYRDCDDQLSIFPEILVMEALKQKNSVAAIWWLSVDNFLRRKSKIDLVNKLEYASKVILRERPLLIRNSLKKLVHFSKAEYDRLFLSSLDLNSYNLTGPINPIFLGLKDLLINDLSRKDVILYYPRKDAGVVDRLRNAIPDFTFRSLNGLSRLELIEAYKTSKLFVDFGHHPGRERMVREAAVCGCCVLTNRRGSAGNQVDIPIKAHFKLDESAPYFYENFKEITLKIFNNFDILSIEFDDYRQIIKSENTKLRDDICNLLNISTIPAR